MNLTPPDETTSGWTHLLLFDGVCNFCDQTVQWVLEHDQKGIVRFCSIQSELGSRLYRESGFDPSEPHSMMLITPEARYVKSTAAIELAKLMGGWMRLAGLLRCLPTFLRDWGYGVFAANRYRWFGKKDACVLPRPEWRNRFIG